MSNLNLFLEEALGTTTSTQQKISKETDDLLKTIIETCIDKDDKSPPKTAKDIGDKNNGKREIKAEAEEQKEEGEAAKEGTLQQKLGRPVGSFRPEGPQQPLINFTPRHMDIIRRLVTGQTQREIAAEMGYTESRLSIIVNSPLFQHKLKEYQKQIADKLADNIGNIDNRVRLLQPKALDTLEELLEKKGNDRLRRDCAKDLLDIGGNLGKKRDEEGMNDFARIISDAFKMALSAHQPLPELDAIDITPTPQDDQPAVEVEENEADDLLIGNS